MKFLINRPITSAKIESTTNNVIVRFDTVSLMQLYTYGKERSKRPLFEAKDELKIKSIE